MSKILVFDELREHGVRLGRSQLARLEKVGKFPKRVRISEGRIGWLESEILAYIAARIERR
jgi:prophage regulatory protein